MSAFSPEINRYHSPPPPPPPAPVWTPPLVRAAETQGHLENLILKAAAALQARDAFAEVDDDDPAFAAQTEALHELALSTIDQIAALILRR